MKQYRFVIDRLLSIQLILLVIIGVVERHPTPNLHMILGIVFAGTLGGHMFLQQRWLGSVLRRYPQTPAPVRTSLYLAVVLMILFWINFGSGLFGALAESPHLAHLHVLTAWPFVGVNSIHLFRHRKWVRKMTLQRMPG